MSEITIRHKEDIDKCIASEIKELNNKQNILTLYSCCGHDKGEYGYVVVHEWDEEKMIELGYAKNGVYSTNANGYTNKYSSFEAKSICKGRC